MKAHPDRVASFRAASVKGWAYALAHKEATVDLILRKYSAKRAGTPCCLRLKPATRWSGGMPTGSANRIPRAGNASPPSYRQLGLTDDTLPAALIWDGNDGSLRRWLIPLVLVRSDWRLRRWSRIETAAPCGPNHTAERAPVCHDGAAKTEPDHVAAVHRPQHSRPHFHPDL